MYEQTRNNFSGLSVLSDVKATQPQHSTTCCVLITSSFLVITSTASDHPERKSAELILISTCRETSVGFNSCRQIQRFSIEVFDKAVQFLKMSTNSASPILVDYPFL